MTSLSTRSSALLALLVAAILAACGGASEEFSGTPVDDAPPPRLEGVNWDGEPFRLSDLDGEVSILFFGYTFCPDVCPLTLAKMKQLFTLLGDRTDEVNVVFVSVDPRRDTVEKLARYVPSFDERFYGIHLEEEQLRVVQEDLGLSIQYGQPKDGPDTDSFYYVDHTGSYFLVGRDGRVRVTFPPNATAADLAPDVDRLLGS